MTHVTRSEEDTRRVARDFASGLAPGDVVQLSGDLGAGKTAFVKGLAEGLDIDPDDVSSPTFTLIHEYRGGRLPLYHADLYRLEAAATEDLGLEELGIGGGILAIEWPERLSHAIAGTRSITITIVDDTTRAIMFDAPTPVP